MTHRETKLVRASREPRAGLAPSLERAVTFHNMPLAHGGSPYGRSEAPVAAEAESLLGELEDATALVFASGMTAWTALCLAVARPDRAVALPTVGYYGYETHAQAVLEPFGIEVRRYEATDLDAMREAADGASLTLTESPLNSTLDVIDIAAAAEAAHAGGGLLVCDNTAASPLLQLPLDLGADVTLQSDTKYLAGHSDALAGVLGMRDTELAGRIRHVRSETGMVLGPDPSWLLLRGLRTLAVRVQRQC